MLSHPSPCQEETGAECKKNNNMSRTYAKRHTKNCIDPIKLILLMDTLIKSQFIYCPLVCMFHDRRANAKFNKVFESTLRSACNDSGNNSEKNSVNNYVNNYCNPNKSLTIHQCNFQLLMIEIFKTKYNLNPTFMKDIFTEKNNYYSLRNPNHSQLPKARTTIYGTQNIQLRGCSHWSSLPNSLKDRNILQEF